MCLTAPFRPTMTLVLPCLDCEEQMPDPDNFAFNNASGELRQSSILINSILATWVSLLDTNKD